jgi:predicted nucleic acid-binding protein
VIVVDASAAVKWFLPEAGSEQAGLLLNEHSGAINGPDLLAIEVCATFVRGANMVPSNRGEAMKFLSRFKAMLENETVILHRTSTDQLHRAATLAIDLGHPLKDCIYLALAMGLRCALITADVRFATKAQAVYGDVRVLGV